MNITQVKIFPVEEEKLKAFVSVVFDHCFMVNDIKVIQGKDGLFLSMPSRRKKSGEFKDVAHPLNNETRRMIEETVLSEYWAIVDDATPRRPDREEPESGSVQADDSTDDSKPAPGIATPRPGAGTNGSGRPSLPPLRVGNDQLATGPAHRPAADPGDTMEPAASSKASGSKADGAEKSEAESGEQDEPTLEEVQELHLSDSFWTVS